MHNPLFAEIDANGWATIVGAIGIVLANILGMILAHFRAKEVASKVEQVAVKQEAAAVKQEVVSSRQEAAVGANAARLDDMVAKVEEVHRATNSMKDELVAKTEREAHARGGVEERERARAEAQGPLAAAPSLVQAIEAVPEKTAERVVEKLKDVRGA